MNTEGEVIKLSQRQANLATTKERCFWHLFIHSFNKYWLTTYYAPVKRLGTSKQKQVSTERSALRELPGWWHGWKQENAHPKTRKGSVKATSGWEFLKIFNGPQVQLDSRQVLCNLEARLLLEANHWFRLKQWRPILAVYESQARFHCPAFWPIISRWVFALWPIFVSLMYLAGCLLCWLCPNTMYYLSNVLVIFLCNLKKKKKKKKSSALSRWEEEKVPSISQVVFDDSDCASAQGYPVSTQQTRTEHQELKKRDDFMTSALKGLPLSASGGDAPENSHETMGQVCTVEYRNTNKWRSHREHCWQTPAPRIREQESTHCIQRTASRWKRLEQSRNADLFPKASYA